MSLPYVDRRSGQSQHRCNSTNAMKWFPLTLIIDRLRTAALLGLWRERLHFHSSIQQLHDGGTVYGLSGAGLVLQNNASNKLTVNEAAV